jgi:hypothetical protein
MSLIDNPAYCQLERSLGEFEATMLMAKKAREITSSLDNRITCAQALDYAARGDLPDPKDYPDHRLDRVKEYVTYVNDINIRSAVIASYEQSLAKNNLVYDYKTVSDEPRQSRVRIIMNILWDNRPHKNY